MRSYRHTEYALRAQDIAAMDAEADYRQWARAADRQLAEDHSSACCECGIGHVGACDAHAVQVALVLAGVQR